MKTGVVLGYWDRLDEEISWCAAHDIMTCQLHLPLDHRTDADVEYVRGIVNAHPGFEITALISLWSGPMVWDFVDGPATLGIVPAAYRHQRCNELIEAARFAKKLGVADVNTHMGFIPECPTDPEYRGFILAARYVASNCKALGIHINFETGQETPVTMLRAITDIGLDNVGVNFDPANLLMYGKANPLDGLGILGRHVRGVHAKDGDYPTNGSELGEEKALGKGSVNVPALVAKLKALGYDGALTIEREITGPEQREDVLTADALLKSLI